MVEEGAVMNEVPFDYSIRTHPAWIEGSPDSIGDRFIRTLDALSESEPSIFTNWEITDRPTKSSVPLATARSRIGTMVENNVARGELDEPDPDYGYDVWAFTRVDDQSRAIQLWINGVESTLGTSGCGPQRSDAPTICRS